MDNYGYQQHHAVQPYAYNNTLAMPSSFSTSYIPNVSHGLFSEGIFPAYDQLQSDTFYLQSDQQSFHCLMVNLGSDQFDPLHASLELSNSGTPIPHDLPIYGRPSFGSSESAGTESIGSPLLWSNALLTNGVDTGVTLLCDQMHYHPLQVISDNDTNECEIIPNGKDGAKNEVRLNVRAKRCRKRSARKMRESDKKESSNNSLADLLTWEVLSQYFYMPIAQAARELNIGLTLFKKRCRELGVRRWPHRKLMSIQSLIKNVKEMEKDGVDPSLSKVTVRNAIQELENQRKRMEVMPDIELEAQTKRLRQACFKANYKKRRLMIMNGGGMDSSKGSSCSNHGIESNIVVSSVNSSGSFDDQDLEECDELKSLLFDSLSPADCSFLNEYM